MDYIRKQRIVWICCLLVIMLLALIYRLGHIEITKGSEYALKAWKQRTIRISLESHGRGDFLDRNFKSLLDQQTEQRLAVFPSLIQEKEAAAKALAPIIGVPTQELLQRLRAKSAVWPEQLTAGQIAGISRLNLAGVSVSPMVLRYGAAPLAANTLGYLGKVSSQEELTSLQSHSAKQYRLSDLVGKTGLELTYEEQLKGSRQGRGIYATIDGTGKQIKGLGLQIIQPGADAGRKNLILTIDRDIQQMVESIMERRGIDGSVVIMEAGTGDLLALASRPTYRPDQVSKYLKMQMDGMFLDQSVLLWQPGSVLKVLVACAALEEGIAEPESFVPCDKKLVTCNISKPHSGMTLSQALELSCNPAFARLGLQLGGKRLEQYARRLGLASREVIGYPVLKDARQDWSRVGEDLVNSSIGQGPVLTTPVQITGMLATIANKGVYYQPRLVKEIRSDTGGIAASYPAAKGYRAISAVTAQKMTTMLEGVTLRGTGRNAALGNIRVAGKTGSAQVGKGAGVDAWFTGYFPVESPRYVVTVLVHHGITGGESAAPLFRELAEQLTTGK